MKSLLTVILLFLSTLICQGKIVYTINAHTFDYVDEHINVASDSGTYTSFYNKLPMSGSVVVTGDSLLSIHWTEYKVHGSERYRKNMRIVPLNLYSSASKLDTTDDTNELVTYTRYTGYWEGDSETIFVTLRRKYLTNPNTGKLEFKLFETSIANDHVIHTYTQSHEESW